MQLTHAALLATLACTVPAASRAADVTPAQARTLEDQLRAYFSTMVGPDVPVERSPIRVIPEGDHFSLSLPLGGKTASGPTAPALLGEAKPIDGGRWALDHLHITSPATFTTTMKVPDGQAAPRTPKPGAAKPGTAKAGTTTTVPVTYTVTYAEQDGTGAWDPSYATPSILNSNSRGFRLEASGPAIQQTTTLDQTTGTITLRPTGGDQVDLVMDVAGTGYALINKSTDALEVDAQAQKVRVTGEVTGMSRDHASALIPALIRIGKLQQAGQPAAAKPGMDKAATDSLIQAMQGLASAMTLTETIDALQVHAGGFNGSFAQVRVGVDGKADAGFLTGRMDLAMDGLTLAGMPLGPMQDLLPQRIALRPVVSHASTKDLLQMLQTQMDNPKGGPTQAEIDALFSHGSLKAGLESFAFDVGGASFTGTADIDVASPQQASGAAQVTAAGWDVLFTKIQGTPELAQGIPMMLLAKGIAKTAGDRLVWDITYRDKKLLVNGTDLSQMAGAGR